MDDSIRGDILNGAEEISDFTGFPKRRVFYLAERGQLPVFKVGGLLHARKSTLRQFFADREAAAVRKGDGEAA